MLSTTARYAIRALARIARSEPDSVCLGKDLAQETGIPANYLAKILLALKNAGVVATARGSHGGYWLARRASDIRLLEIVGLFDTVELKPECLLGEHECCSGSCSAHDRWHKVLDAYVDYLQTTTLAEVAGVHGSNGANASRVPIQSRFG